MLMSEFHQEHFGENLMLIPLFVSELSPNIENSKWAPVVFAINMNFSYDQLDTKVIICVKYQNSGISSFGGSAGTMFELTEIVKNSK